MSKRHVAGLNRRKFVLGATMAGAVSAARKSPGATRDAAPNLRLFDLNHNWTFSRSQSMDNAERVTLPHSNVLLPWHSFDDRAYEFVSYYQRQFRAPEAWRGKRVFIDFDGAMTAATVTINGQEQAEYRGGYTPFSYELTPICTTAPPTRVAVELDSTERPDIPPFGGNIDYLTFGGIYREVRLRAVPTAFIDNVFAKPVRVLSDAPRPGDAGLSERSQAAGSELTVELKRRRQGPEDRRPCRSRTPQPSITTSPSISLAAFDCGTSTHPVLYDVACSLKNADGTHDEYETRVGFREAASRPAGFLLNGGHVKLRGLNRHQTFPYVGGAMPARVQRRDAQILKKELKLQPGPHLALSAIARTSSMPATNSACWCSKRSPAGSTSATSRGRTSPFATWAR